MRQEPVVLNRLELSEIVSSANNIDYMGIKGAGWAAYFAILRLFGKRVTEVITLRTQDVWLEDGYLQVRFRIGKSHRPVKPVRVKQIREDNQFVETIMYYRNNVDGEWLFPAIRGGHINRRYAWDVCKMIRDDLTNHSFRHTLATQLAERGFTAFEIQNWFDWSKLNTAAEYVHSSGVMTRRISDMSWEAKQDNIGDM